MGSAEKENAIYPHYTENDVYKELLGWAESAGITVKYAGVDVCKKSIGTSYLGTDAHIVTMRSDYTYKSIREATLTFAHEIGHTLTKTFYHYALKQYIKEAPVFKYFQEADANILSVAFYILAEMSANQKIYNEGKSQIMSDIENREIPHYNDVFEELVSLAEQAGITVEYARGEDISTANSFDARPNVNRVTIASDYQVPQMACFRLAHEIAHTLTKTFYPYVTQYSENISGEKLMHYEFQEAHADNIGVGICALATMIAKQKEKTSKRQAPNT